MDKPETTSFYRRNLPHWLVSERSYFVTFRLKGSIPEDVLASLKIKKNILQKLNETAKTEFIRREFALIEKILDSNKTDLHLNSPMTAEIITNAFDWAEKQHCWKCYSYVVMPNHVHCLMSGTRADNDLSDIMRLIKGYTSYRINKVINKKGALWTPEIFDHWCRTPDKEESVVRYIRNNPVKAGLVKKPEDWPWLR